MTIRVIIADDHSVVRQGLRMFLALDPEIQIVGEAADGNAAVRLARQLLPDVVLMDLIMPGMDGFAAIQTIHRTIPGVEVVVLTSVLGDASVLAAMRAGAIGYLLKTAHPDELCRAIHSALAGTMQLSPQAAARLVHEVDVPGYQEPLTEREIDVLRLLAQGKANKEIALMLNVGETTVKTHVSKILNKLGLPSRTQAALFAVKNGLVSNQQV